MLIHRLRRWPNIKPRFGLSYRIHRVPSSACLLIAGLASIRRYVSYYWQIVLLQYLFLETRAVVAVIDGPLNPDE